MSRYGSSVDHDLVLIDDFADLCSIDSITLIFAPDRFNGAEYRVTVRHFLLDRLANAHQMQTECGLDRTLKFPVLRIASKYCL